MKWGGDIAAGKEEEERGDGTRGGRNQRGSSSVRSVRSLGAAERHMGWLLGKGRDDGDEK